MEDSGRFPHGEKPAMLCRRPWELSAVIVILMGTTILQPKMGCSAFPIFCSYNNETGKNTCNVMKHIL